MRIVIREGGVRHPVMRVTDGVPDSYCVENDAVREFRANVSYTKAYIEGTGGTKVTPYIYARNDAPPSWTEIGRPVMITGTGSELRLTCDGKTKTYANTGGGGVLVYDLVPGKTYTWTMGGRSGSFTTTGTVRMMHTGLPNMRDIGGYACSGGQVAYGRLYRSDGMVMTANGEYDWIRAERDGAILSRLKELGIVREIDLRGYLPSTTTKNYLSYAHDPGTPASYGIGYVQLELNSYTMIGSNPDMTYHMQGEDVKRPVWTNLREILETMAGDLDGGSKAVWYHCKTGADRTGVLTAVILALLGVSADDIVKDYELTCLSGVGYSVSLNDKQSVRTVLKALWARDTNGTLAANTESWLTGKVGVSADTLGTLRRELVE